MTKTVLEGDQKVTRRLNDGTPHQCARAHAGGSFDSAAGGQRDSVAVTSPHTARPAETSEACVIS
jgi:hypothetical protein